jgi:hypothetical protein
MTNYRQWVCKRTLLYINEWQLNPFAAQFMIYRETDLTREDVCVCASINGEISAAKRQMDLIVYLHMSGSSTHLSLNRRYDMMPRESRISQPVT